MTDTPASPPAVRRFVERARAAGLDPSILTFPDGTRTAADAAAAVGCELGHIVKSLVFVAVWSDETAADDATTEEPVLVLTSGTNRVDTARVAAALGADRLRKADAGEVRDATGYAIGGTPPVGHDTDLRVVCDRDLLAHPTVWAAAGHPTTVFELTPQTLVAAAGALVADVAG